jgi:hypothetical protein
LKSRMISVFQNFDGLQICPCSDTITPDVYSGVQIFLVLVVDIYDVLEIWFVSKVVKVRHDLQWPMSSVQT